MRRRKAPKREVIPDPKYRDVLISRFINVIMERGKKSLARRIVYNALEVIEEKAGKPAVEVFKQAVDNVRPLLETKSRRVGGATYQVPIEVTMERGQSVAMRWIKTYSRAKKGQAMEMRLAKELLDGFNKTGSAFKKREDTHRMADANKAFSHYRW